ncbi:hypothetical protein, partial [Thiomicrospira microaerophila]|uniref:hypothetical protein n=1 Tax=Thiomicrospira microaerophila TaxID=406020 RepID=UPI001E4E0410
HRHQYRHAHKITKQANQTSYRLTLAGLIESTGRLAGLVRSAGMIAPVTPPERVRYQHRHRHRHQHGYSLTKHLAA